jgi:hypothetical protein
VQRLLTTADLKTQTDLRWATDLMGMLSWKYEEFIKNDVNGYSYTVSAGPESDRKPGIHGSEISGCQRRLVYGIATERRPEGTNVNMRMRFRLGTAVHAMLQDEFRRLCLQGPFIGPGNVYYAMSFEAETKIIPSIGGPAADHGIDSSSDGIFTFYAAVNEPEPHWEACLRFLLEIKTKSKDEFEKMKAPDKDHIEQTHLYMGCLDLPITWLLYYNKSNSNFTKPVAPYAFRFNEKLWSELEMRFLRSNSMAAMGQLPDRTEGMHCGWCPFTWTCQPSILPQLRSSSMPVAPPVASSNALRRLGGKRK